MWTNGSSKTTTSANGSSGTVQNINEDNLIDADIMSKEQVRAFGFSWKFGKWTRELQDDATPVPFYGYRVYNVNSLAKPIDSYTLYICQEDGSRTKVDDFPGNVTSYTYDKVDSRSEYIFVIVSKDSQNTCDGLDSNKAYLYQGNKSIYTIIKTESDGLVDTYTITYTDGTTSTFKVANGAGIKGVESSVSDDGLTTTYKLKFSDGLEVIFSVKDGKDGTDGDDGIDGQDGTDGRGIVSIEKTSSKDGVDGKDGADGKDGLNGINGLNGLDGRGIVSIQYVSSEANMDVYTIVYTDGTTSNFVVKSGKDGTDGKNGTDGEDGTNGINGNNGSNGANGNNGANGKDGANGTDGKDGVGIENIVLDDNGCLIFTMSDGKNINAGSFVENKAFKAQLTDSVATMNGIGDNYRHLAIMALILSIISLLGNIASLALHFKKGKFS